MSRASGAGAYSQGIAWPSPRPQLFGARSPVVATRVSESVAIGCIMAPVMVRPRSAYRPVLLGAVLAAALGGCSLLNRTSPPSTFVDGAWRQVADAPLALTEVAAATLDDRIWVAGGLTAAGAG